jgi:1-acyl-sn-glycerol-3-phosphate acyltransferase
VSKRHAVRPHIGWKQVQRISVGALRPTAERARRYAIELLYASWFWTLFSLFSAVTFLLMLSPLRRALTWSIAHHAARTFIRGAGIELSVRWQEPLRSAGTHIVVANHPSYLDALFVLAALPYSCRFVAKREVEHSAFLRTEIVEQSEEPASVARAEHLTEIVRAGHSCIFFPEGTFTRSPGLLPFHLDAFTAAVAASVPVLPIAIRGTRSVLCEGQWVPKRGRVIVTVAKPIMPLQLPNVFTAAVQLRDAARSSIRRHCGEPDTLATSAQKRITFR